MTKDLCTTKDVKEVREELIKEQGGCCLLTGLPVEDKQWVLDHKHDSEQLVRGALHRQSNVVLGKIENLQTRYLYWYPGTLSDFLRQCADYLEKPVDTRYRHPGWIKKLLTEFRKLNETQKKQVLKSLDSSEGKNTKERIELFKKIIMNKDYTRNQLLEKIKEV